MRHTTSKTYEENEKNNIAQTIAEYQKAPIRVCAMCFADVSAYFTSGTYTASTGVERRKKYRHHTGGTLDMAGAAKHVHNEVIGRMVGVFFSCSPFDAISLPECAAQRMLLCIIN